MELQIAKALMTRKNASFVLFLDIIVSMVWLRQCLQHSHSVSAGRPQSLAIVDSRGQAAQGAEVLWLTDEELRNERTYSQHSLDPYTHEWELLRNKGHRVVTDKQGMTTFPVSNDVIAYIVEHGEDFGYGKVKTGEAAFIELLADDALSIRVVDLVGTPIEGIDVVLGRHARGLIEEDACDLLYERGVVRWIGLTNGSGYVHIPHWRHLCPPGIGEIAFVAIGIPLKDREVFVLDYQRRPIDPVILCLPATGTVNVSGDLPEGALVRIRPLHDCYSGELWSSYSTSKRILRSGRAVFSAVGLGLDLDVQVWWPGLPVAIVLNAESPTEEGSGVDLVIDVPSWWQDFEVNRSPVVVDSSNKERKVANWIAATAISSDNTQFNFCFTLDDASALSAGLCRLYWKGLGALDIDSHDGHMYAQIPNASIGELCHAVGIKPSYYKSRPCVVSYGWSVSRVKGERYRVDLEISNYGSKDLICSVARHEVHPNPSSLFRFEASATLPTTDESSVIFRATSSPTMLGLRLGPNESVMQSARLYPALWGFGQEGDTFDCIYTFLIADPVPIFSEPTYCEYTASNCVEMVRGHLRLVD